MVSGWRYRVASSLGTAVLVAIAVGLANVARVQEAFARVPYFGRPAPELLSTGEWSLALATTLVVVLGSMWPLFKPRPRRILDAVLLTQKRVLLAMVALAALGYFNYTYRLPRTTLMLTTATLFVTLPAMVVAIRTRPRARAGAVLVGDDPEAMAASLDACDRPVLGTVTPPAFAEGTLTGVDDAVARRLADLPSLGGFARLEEVFVENDVDTALLAFRETDRSEFFGTLETCYDHGVSAQVHRDHADHVLTAEPAAGELFAVDLEPWDPQEYVVKRAFDIAFATAGLVVLAPVFTLIAATIKLDSSGPVLYGQERTAAFGETFRVYKFRSMVPEAEADTGVKLSEEDNGGVDPRVTRVGRLLRQTHLDEIPQLWSILTGDMSVVGPRPERPELDSDMEQGAGQWRRRWFVRPGLTGLAQIRGATGHQPETKLRHDVEYIRRQSLWFDLKIVIRQFWQVGTDCVAFLRSGGDDRTERADDASGDEATDGGRPTEVDE